MNAWTRLAVHTSTVASRSFLHGLLGFFLLMLSACSGKHEAADAGACVNEPGCTCGDGATGRKVCDLDTRSFVMCLCELGASVNTERDAGPSQPAREPEAGRAATQPATPSAAGSGGAAPADAGNNNGQHGRRGR